MKRAFQILTFPGVLACLAACSTGSLAQSVPASVGAAASTHGLLSRHYQDGEKLVYRMKGINERWQYEIQADGVVKKDAEGRPVEEYAWSHLTSNRPGDALSPAAADFRQVLSLAPSYPLSVPDLSKVILIVGPITDMLTIYADMLIATNVGKLEQPGDHFYFKSGTPNSWADGTYVQLGEDSIDFDLSLKAVDRANQITTLLIRHVPPAKPMVRLPADWMHEPVSDTPNNWVEVTKTGEGHYVAEVGKETFDVEVKISTVDGKIMAATIDNPVVARQRECTDAALTQCGEARPRQIHRHIELTLVK